ncbi:MAG: hypothetical protein Kow00108_26740 [Calditrichia bacterium]
MGIDKKIRIDQILTGKLKLSAIFIDGIHNEQFDSRVWNEMENVAEGYKKRFNSFSECKPLLEPARILYKSIRIEPSRYRPASEALIKRVLQDKPLYRINKAVDFANMCSLKFMLPVGLYDRNKIRGDILISIGKEHDKYVGLGKPEVLLHDKFVLFDEMGPFGNPSSDSLRTSVDLETKDLLFIYYFPSNFGQEQINIITRKTVDLINEMLQPVTVDYINLE